MNNIRRKIIIEEYEKITKKNVADPVKFWALYATSFYERLFNKIDSLRQLEKAYKLMQPKMKRPDEKKALEFFYQLRKQELEGTFKWEVKMENKIREIIREEIKSILSEKNIKTQKWNKLQSWMTTPSGVPKNVKVKSGDYVAGYLDGNTLYIEPRFGKVTKKQVRSESEADDILLDIEKNKGK